MASKHSTTPLANAPPVRFSSSRCSPVHDFRASPSLLLARSLEALILSRDRLGAVITLGLIALLSGCNVGPRYTAPAAPAAPAFKESSPAAYSAAPPGAWKPAQPQDAVLKGKWWEMFNEPELNELEDQLDINNQNIAQYFQNFMAARAQVSEARAGYFPTVSANPTFTKGGTGGSSAAAVATNTGASTGTTTGTAASPVSVSTGYTTIALPIDVSWEPDLWDRVRNTVREYQYAAQVTAADLENERLTEQADLAEYYFQLRGQDALQDLYNRMIEVDRQSLDLTRALYETGIDNQVSVDEAQVTLENAQEAATGIATNRAIYEHAIAMLIGKPASSFSMPIKNLTTPLPAIPVGVPSELLQRRPDIAAAERAMAEANALIGVEKAAYYPTLSLTGSGGLQSSAIGKLFSIPALFWSLGASASETIFDAGLRKATVAQYTAQYNADVAAYKQTVLTAFQQVEDYIATLRVTSEQIERQQQAIDSSQRYVTHETSRYETGLDPYLLVTVAQLTLLSNQQTQVALRVSEMTAAVELVQALGGGWNVNELPAASAIRSKETPRQVSDTP
jgi:NodT family efflux transporter outer membrane factor (OMF) lipoprotein